MTHLTLFDRAFPRLFDDFFAFAPAPRLGTAPSRWAPPVDVRETDSELRIEAELPGVPRENISVRFHDGRLILDGRRDELLETPAPTQKKVAKGDASLATSEKADAPRPEGWSRRERFAGRFHRSFELPDSVDTSAIRAESKDGVLTVVLPKLEKAQPRQIEVSVH